MIKKITLQFSLYRSVISSDTEGQNQLQVLFPRMKLLQVCKQGFYQICKKKEMANEYPQVNLSVHSTHLFK